jgi:hypothetical protein
MSHQKQVRLCVAGIVLFSLLAILLAGLKATIVVDPDTIDARPDPSAPDGVIVLPPMTVHGAPAIWIRRDDLVRS